MIPARGPVGLLSRIDRIAAGRPDLVLMTPFLLYLVLLALRDFGGDWNPLARNEFRWLASIVRTIPPLLLVWLVRKHLPPWGRANWHVAVPAGVVAAFGWFYGQYLFNWMGVPHRLPLPLFAGQPEWVDAVEVMGGATPLFWLTAAAHVGCAITAVPVVEELLWRAFLLRALIHWSEFEKVPLGAFSWRAFIGTSLLSTVQHPDNWLVSILCWMFFNALMYWRKSILCLVLVHAVTNLVLYAWVIFAALALGDGDAWMHLSLVAPAP